MPVQPPIVPCSTDDPVNFTHIKSLGDPNQLTSLYHQQKAGSADSFSSLHAPSSSSGSSQLTGSTDLYQTICDDTESHADSSTEVSKPQFRGEVPLLKQLWNFFWSLFDHESHAYLSFLRVYPEYYLTWPIDTLRKYEYKRLKRSGEVYVDYTGASLYPEGLIRSNSAFLDQAILGNTHSISTR